MKRTNIEAKKATGQEALRLARKKAYRDVLALRGKIDWTGDPAALRRAKGR